MSNKTRYILIFLSVALLAAIRFFESHLFYDPYLRFFENDYLYIDSPRRETFKLTMFTTLRYILNTLISLGIIWLVFKDRGIVKFSTVLYGIAYLILLIFYLYFVINPRQEDYYLFFNIRRFLIQPLLLVIFLPAFYYYKIRR
ncbi:MAG: exosortase F system-associated protein [Flavobacteriaceae bacterium]|nr:exosortase F system-associated protein [Flavobacteriaceae bacterium]